MRRHPLLAVFSLTAVALLAGLWAAFVRAEQANPPATAPSGVALVEVSNPAAIVEFTPPANQPGKVEAELLSVEGNKVLARTSMNHQGKPVRVGFAARFNPEDLAQYYVRWRFDDEKEWRQQSLFYLSEVLETIVLGQRDLVAGTKPILRIIVNDKASGTPLKGAAVKVALTENDKPIAEVAVTTNERGQAEAPLSLPDREIQGAQLTVDVSGRTAKDSIKEVVNIKGGTKTLLTTDKPVYQPGQVIHIRALSLSKADMKPRASAPVVFEVEDAKGNKVYKNEIKTNEFGVSSADFTLADELNKGTYRIRAIVAGDREEKTVNVDRYVLPKYKLELTTDRKFYEPGQVVKAQLQADYFFGKPVAGAKVQVKCAKFDVAFQDFQTVEGKTDDNGHYTFDVALPQDFVGQPLEAGKASAKFEITLTDTADHKETVTRNLTVTGAPIIVAAVPESGELVPDLQNKVYIVATYADSTPAQCAVTWSNPPDGKPVTVQTDEAGFAQVTLTPKPNEPLHMRLLAKDPKGSTGKVELDLTNRPAGDEQILVRTDRSICRVGDKLAIAVTSTRKTGTVYLDLVKDRQTCLTQSLDLVDGKASAELAMDAALAGTVQVNAYVLGQNGNMVRDRRLIVVDPANDLRISVKNDQDSYLPGTQADIQFNVTDAAGKGVAAALGVIVVDEAVFALQEMQPGLEKIYFYLEQEIAKPRYEIHGFSLDGIMPMPMPHPMPLEEPAMRKADAARDAAARVLLASAKGVENYGISVNTYNRDRKDQQFQQRMGQQLAQRYNTVIQGVSNYVQKHQKPNQPFTGKIDLATLVKEKYLKEADILDPWGHPMKLEGAWGQGPIMLSSAGIDGRYGSADDVEYPQYRMMREEEGMMFGGAMGGAPQGMVRRGGMARNKAMADGPMMEMAAMAQPMAAPAAAGMPQPGNAAAEPPRIREYFPETLLFQPSLITDGNGLAKMNLSLADSITTWRMSCMASSAGGAMGSSTAPLRVFQEFFVDIDFPVALTQNDQISVPVAVYNYLKTEQEVKLTVDKAEWFELNGPAEQVVKLGPSEVKAVYFNIVAKKIGYQKFTVTGMGSKKSDAIARSVEILPDGKEFLVSQSGRLGADVSHTINIPDNAIADASKVFVKVYPGMLSQVVEGLDSMLRMPSGCFEQTSSATYPNVLVMDYMKATRKLTPEIQMKAESFINNGYQRLVSFEVPGGGFEWFGKAPAHRILTAYGLMEFHDMSKVHPVDPAVISRTQNWLASAQESDGSYKPTQGGIAEGAINKFTDDVMRNTAYITWALASTGYQGPQVGKGIDYIVAHMSDMKDTYSIAVAANALATVKPEDKATLDLLKKLMDKRVEEGELVYWKNDGETPCHGTGAAGDIELTALAAQAFIRCGQDLGTVNKAIGYLAKNKDAYGTWQSTQATIQALKAMLLAERGANAKCDASIVVEMNGKPVKTLKVDNTNSDVLQLVDLKDQTQAGANAVALKISGKGALMYQVVGRYYLPYIKEQQPEEKEPLSIDLKYDRKQLATNDLLGVTATVTNNRPGSAQMVVVDLGLPPGFTLIPDKLNKAVESGAIEKYSVTGRQIIVYLREVKNAEPLKIEYQLQAKFPLKAQSAKSVAYEYYNPAIRAESTPIQLEVVQ